MQIDDPAQIPTIAQKTGFSIFAFPRGITFDSIDIKPTLTLQPKTEKNKSGEIKVNDVLEVFSIINAHHTDGFTLLVKPAENLNDPACNAFLKNLEEPNENLHIIFFTHDLQHILPTIRSRAFVYHLKDNFEFESAPNADKKDLDLAKSLLAATPAQLPQLADQLHKQKDNNRLQTLAILDIAIELAYKTYFKTSDSKWLKKLQQLTDAYDAVRRNGHIKLQVVANML